MLHAEHMIDMRSSVSLAVDAHASVSQANIIRQVGRHSTNAALSPNLSSGPLVLQRLWPITFLDVFQNGCFSA